MLNLFKQILNAIGMPYKNEKTEGLTTCLTYLGIQLNTLAMTATIPDCKRKQIIRLLRTWAPLAFITLTELQSLIDSLMWLTQVVPHGRIFIQSLINKTKGQTRGSMKIRLYGQAIKDI